MLEWIEEADIRCKIKGSMSIFVLNRFMYSFDHFSFILESVVSFDIQKSVNSLRLVLYHFIYETKQQCNLGLVIRSVLNIFDDLTLASGHDSQHRLGFSVRASMVFLANEENPINVVLFSLMERGACGG